MKCPSPACGKPSSSYVACDCSPDTAAFEIRLLMATRRERTLGYVVLPLNMLQTVDDGGVRRIMRLHFGRPRSKKPSAARVSSKDGSRSSGSGADP